MVFFGQSVLSRSLNTYIQDVHERFGSTEIAEQFFTEHNGNINVTDAKYLEYSCTDPIKQTVRGVVMQEAEQVGDSPEDVDADIQRKRIR